MAERKHPVLFGIGISTLIILGFVFLRVAAAYFLKEDSILSFGNRIGVVTIRGFILESKEVIEQLKKFRKDENIKAIILRIDSPGGGTAASQEIYREVLRTTPKKKVVVSMGNIAASGGYYIALGANKIVANPATLTGSIGVIMEFSNFKELLNKIGVETQVVKSGPFKDIGSPLRSMKPEEQQLLKEVIDNVHDQFIEVVAKGRRLSRNQVEKIADGRIFTGKQAKALGLVDELGSFEDTVDIIKKMAGLTGEVKLIFSEKKKISLWDIFFSSLVGEFRQQVQNIGVSSPLLYLAPFFYKN